MGKRGVDDHLPRSSSQERICAYSVRNVVEEYLREFKEMQAGLRGLMNAYRQHFKLVGQVARQAAQPLEVALESMRPYAQIFEDTRKALRDALEKLPERQGQSYVVLANRGWYIDFNMPISLAPRLAKAFEEGGGEAAEQALIAYYEESLPEIIAALQTNYPKRADILKAAFAAHARHEYELSVPVFLAQADGICQELLRASPFQRRRRDGKPATADWVEKAGATGLAREALCLLADPMLPICLSKRERGEGFVGLNRHQVLHGESCDYGTQTNSLKAASFLNFAGDFVTRTARRRTRT